MTHNVPGTVFLVDDDTYGAADDDFSDLGELDDLDGDSDDSDDSIDAALEAEIAAELGEG